MGDTTWRNFAEEAELADGHAEFFDELESYGWYARSRWGDNSIRFWPDGGRGKQIHIDLRYPLNEHRREAILENAKTYSDARQNEGGN
ncbi:hypothetical protein O5Y58_14085 [Microbacterium paraoxydans]|uniref:hypothetical protein n=1 Tax=Microbacterium paraoxydans TaxID=199592 RepID=UPI00352D9E0A